MGARALLRFDKFRQHPLQARSVLRLWGVCDAIAMREAIEEGLHRPHSEPCACSMRETHHPVPDVLPTFNANAISDLTLPPYTKTVKRKI